MGLYQPFWCAGRKMHLQSLFPWNIVTCSVVHGVTDLSWIKNSHLEQTIDLKSKTASDFKPAKKVYLATAEALLFGTCKLWQAVGQSADPRNECYFTEKRRDLGGAVPNKSTGRKPECRAVMVSHWLSCGVFLLAELVAGWGGILPSSCWGRILPVGGLQLTTSGRVGAFPLLASGLYFEWDVYRVSHN